MNISMDLSKPEWLSKTEMRNYVRGQVLYAAGQIKLDRVRGIGDTLTVDITDPFF